MKTMKTITILLALVLMNGSTHAQGIGHSTVYYDYFSNPQLLYANDVAEDIVADANGNMFVAGEQMKEMSTQGVKVIKYNSGGSVTTEGVYNNTSYREYVKKIIYDGSTYFYVVCNAVHVTTGVSSLLVLKYSATNFTTPISTNFFTGYYNPVDATIAGSGNSGILFIACNKSNGNASSLAVVRLTKSSLVNSLYIQYFYLYNYLNTSDQFRETPKDILYSQTDQAVYVAGGITDTTTNKTAHLIIRLGTNLASVYSMAGTLDFGQNIYNSVALNSSHVYVAGSMRNNPNNKHSWVIRRLNKLNGATVSSRGYNPGTNFYSEAIKITLATATDILVAGYAKDATTSVYNYQVGKYSADLLNLASYYGTSLPYTSVLVDAVSNTYGTTYLTGIKTNGSKKNMFVAGFYALTGGSNFYRDSIVNNNACGNRITLLPSNLFAITGYQDKTSNAFQLSDYKMFTRIYSPIITRLGDETAAATVSAYPNPTNDFVNISSDQLIQQYRLFDLQGRTISSGVNTEDTYTLQLSIGNQAPGIYFISLNDGKAIKIVKN
jgi:hypothetical protein